MGMTVRRTLLNLASLIAVIGAVVSTAAAQPIYQTSFESSSDVSTVNFTLGSLAGQGAKEGFAGWQVPTAATGGTANVIAGTAPLGAQNGANIVSQGANSTIQANVSSTASRVLIRAYHNGAGSTSALVVPDAATQAAAILGFESSGGGYIVKAIDGSLAVKAYVAPAGAPVLSTANWNKIVVSVNYTTKKFDVQVNGAPYLKGLGFFNNVASFNGFQASSQSGANIDNVGFFASDGDYDNDGYNDDLEINSTGGDPLDAAVAPITVADVNGDTEVNLLDAILYARAKSGVIPTTGLTLVDLNNDGSSTAADATVLFNYSTSTTANIGK